MLFQWLYFIVSSFDDVFVALDEFTSASAFAPDSDLLLGRLDQRLAFRLREQQEQHGRNDGRGAHGQHGRRGPQLAQ